MRDELVDLLERPWIEEEVDPLARRQLAGFVLPSQPILAAAELGAALEIVQILEAQAFTACAFSQSFRNFSSPMSVNGCLNIAS